jgi:Kef-type K+ transport system membrane component KefB
MAYALFDLFLIIVLARLLGNLLSRLGQPRVVGEILAGILLGPTLLGDNLSQVIAPLPARPILSLISMLGLILFMFLAGVEYDVSQIQGRARQAGLLALLSVALPALLGFPVAAVLHNSTFAGPQGNSLLPFALFIGAALSVTAFPVMAHILMERGELNTPLGSISVATAGLMSVLMFTYIAFAGAVAAASGFADFTLKLVWIALFLLASGFLVRPWLRRTLAGAVKNGQVSGDGMALLFAGMVLYGLVAHLIGINALVGGFAWGFLLPDDRALRQAVAERVRDVAMILLLPVFFAMAGFSADLKLITLEVLPATGLVLLAAIGGKFLAALPARLTGLSWRETAVLGALFNTRGLLVLVVGLIGLQMHIITNLTFTITVVVALVTNLMTLPLLRALSPTPAHNPRIVLR